MTVSLLRFLLKLHLTVAVFLPLCLARYLPRTMIRHKVTKTTTATTPPIKAWSVPCCPTALGSEGARRREKQRRADEGEVRRGERRRAGDQREEEGKKRRIISRSLCSNEPLSLLFPLTRCIRSRAAWLGENNEKGEKEKWTRHRWVGGGEKGGEQQLRAQRRIHPAK